MSNGWASPGGDSPGAQGSPAAGEGDAGTPRYGQYAPGAGGPPPPPPTFRMAPKPGVIPLRPLTLGDIFGGTFATIRGNPGATLGLAGLTALVVAVPSVLVTIALAGSDLTVTDSAGTKTDLGGQLGLIVSSVFSGIAGVVLAGMLTAVVAEAVLGRRISIADTWRKVRDRLLPLIGLMLLLVAAAVAVLLLATALVVVLALTAGTAVTVVAAIVVGVGVAVGFIWAATKISLAAPALVLERVGPLHAVRRSWQLTRRQWWRILGITLLAHLLVYVVSQVVSLPAAVLTGAGGGSTLGAVVVQLLALIVSALTTPFTAGVTALLYLDQRIRKEALDVRLMAAAGEDGAGAG